MVCVWPTGVGIVFPVSRETTSEGDKDEKSYYREATSHKCDEFLDQHSCMEQLIGQVSLVSFVLCFALMCLRVCKCLVAVR